MAGIREVTEATARIADRRFDERVLVVGRGTEIDRLLEMINTILDISEVELGVARLELGDVDLAKFVRDGVELFLPMAQDKDLRLDCDVPATLAIRGEKKKLQRLLANLLDNAVKYTPPSGAIAVRLAQDADAVRVSVRNSGIGIADADLDAVFHRFYRGDASRSAAGNGLGTRPGPRGGLSARRRHRRDVPNRAGKPLRPEASGERCSNMTTL